MVDSFAKFIVFASYFKFVFQPDKLIQSEIISMNVQVAKQQSTFCSIDFNSFLYDQQ